MKFPSTPCACNTAAACLLWLSLLARLALGGGGAAGTSNAAHHSRRRSLQQQLPLEEFALPGYEQLASCEPDVGVASGLLVDELFGAGSTYQSDCTCSDTSNAHALETARKQAETTLNFTIFTEAFANLQLGSEWNCQNRCATCFPCGNCGVFHGTNVTRIRGLPTTLDDLLAISSTEEGADGESSPTVPLEGSFDTELCLEYTAGDRTGDTVCWGTSLDFATVFSGQQELSELPCSLRYNGEECNSCRVVSLDASDAGCWKADCSNLGGGEAEMVDICPDVDDPQKAAGKFQPLFYLFGADDPAQFTADCSTASTTSAAATTVLSGASASCGLLVLFFIVGLL